MVRLEPMTEEQFGRWRESHTRDYADDKVRSGAWSAEEALRLAEESTEKALPQGLATKDHYLFSVEDEAEDRQVGTIWFGVMDWGVGPAAFVYDVLVFDEFRRKGYGEQAMLALEDKVKELGLDTIALHVFGYNQGALKLYEKVGYEVTDVNMAKRLRVDDAR